MISSRRVFLAQALAAPFACTQRPAPFPVTVNTFDLYLPPITKITVAGAQLYFISDHGAPVVAMAVALRAGHAYDPLGSEGMAAVVGKALLTESTPIVHEQGGTPGLLLSRSLLGITTTVVRDRAGQTLRRLTEQLRTIALQQEALDRALRECKSKLRMTQGELEDIAGLGLIRGELGVQPPSRAWGVGTGTTLDASLVERAASWLAERVRLDELVILLSGAFDDREANTWLDRATESWPTASGTRSTASDPPAREQRLQRLVVPWPREQAMVAIAGIRNPMALDGAVEAIADDVIAGFLRHELRTLLRVTYGVQSRSWATKYGDLRQLGWVVSAEDAGQATQRIEEVLDASESWSLPTTDGDRIRRQVLTNFMADFHGPAQLLSRLLRLADDDHEPTVFENQLELLRVLEPSTVTSMVRAAFPRGQTCVALVANSDALAGLDRVWSTAIRYEPYELLGFDEP